MSNLGFGWGYAAPPLCLRVSVAKSHHAGFNPLNPVNPVAQPELLQKSDAEFYSKILAYLGQQITLEHCLPQNVNAMKSRNRSNTTVGVKVPNTAADIQREIEEIRHEARVFARLSVIEFKKSIRLIILLAMTASASAQNLITNGSFEEPFIPLGYLLFPSESTGISGWVVGPTGDVDIVRNTTDPASDGLQWIDLNGDTPGSLAQTIILTNGMPYLLGFDLAYNNIAPLPVSIEYSIGGITRTFTRLPGTEIPFWQRQTLVFTATNTGPHTLRFRDTSGHFRAGAALDNVSLTPIVSHVSINLYAGVRLEGVAGQSYRIEYVDTLGSGNDWTALTNIVLPSTPYLFLDVGSTNAGRRFYRATHLP
jgi:hypothetical protein